MLLGNRNNKLAAPIIWLSVVLFGTIIAIMVLRGIALIDPLLTKVGSRTGAEVNLIIVYIALGSIPFIPFLLAWLKPIYLIAGAIALLPLFARLNRVFGIYAYNDLNGNPIYISGAAILTGLLFVYLLIRNPHINRRVWSSKPSLAFALFAVSGAAAQFVFFEFAPAIRIAYLVIIVQFLWYELVTGYVDTVEDVYKNIWGIVVAVIVSILLTMFTSGQEVNLIDSNYFISLDSNSLGPNNYYAGLLASTLCLLPVLFYKVRWTGKIMVLASLVLMGKLLVLTGARGAYLSVVPIGGYFFMIRGKGKKLMPVLILFIILVWLFSEQLFVYLDTRSFYLDSRIFQIASVDMRLLWSKYALQALMKWPFFVTGFGMLTYNNLVPSPLFGFPIQGVHQGFLNIWTNAGFVAFVAFIYWLSSAIWGGRAQARRTKDADRRFLIQGLIICLISWIISFMTTGGWYIGAHQEPYLIFTTEVGLLVVLGTRVESKF
jgi:hypothetical protein